MATITNKTTFTIAKPNYGFVIKYHNPLPKAAFFVAAYYFLKQQFKVKYNHEHIR